MKFVSRQISHGILVVALALELLPARAVVADDASLLAIDSQWPGVQEGEYRDLVWYRKFKLDVAGYLSPEIVDRSAVLYKYQLMDISDEACNNVAKWLTSGWLAFATKEDDTYQVFVPAKYQEFVEEREKLEHTIFSKYQHEPEYEEFVSKTVLPEYKAAMHTIMKDAGDLEDPDGQGGNWQHAAYAIADTVGAKVAGAYRGFLSEKDDQDYELYNDLMEKLKDRPVFDESGSKKDCLSYWVDVPEWDAGKQEDALLFLGVKPDLLGGHVGEKVITWNAGSAVVPTGEYSRVSREEEHSIPADFLESIGTKALRY